MTSSETGIRARPVGRVLRLLLGILLIAESGRFLGGAEPGLVVGVIAVVGGLVAGYAALHLLISRRFAVNAWLGAFLALTPVVAVYLFGGGPGQLGALLFLGVSLVLAAARGDGGCEVMTLPGMFFGRRTHLVCIAFSPVDWVEERVGRDR